MATVTRTPTAPCPDATSHDRDRRRDLVALEIPVDRIDPDPDHPRTAYDSDGLERLARSLATHGQIQPIAVRPGGTRGRFVIVSGERRWRAAVMAGLPTVAAVVVEEQDGWGELLELQIVENAQREDLSAMDQARAFQALAAVNGWTARQVARALQLNASTVTRSMALLKLPETLLGMVESGRLCPRVALELAQVRDPETRDALAARAETDGLSVPAVRRLVHPPAAESVGRRVFHTPAGVVTVETRASGGLDALLSAVIDVAHALKAETEARARHRAAGRP